MFLNQDNLVGFNEKTQKKFIINKKKEYKNNIIFNKLFNSWPKVLGTSSITTNKKILDNFFSIVNPLTGILWLLMHYYQFILIILNQLPSWEIN